MKEIKNEKKWGRRIKMPNKLFPLNFSGVLH
jgi:hypothetical protein